MISEIDGTIGWGGGWWGSNDGPQRQGMGWICLAFSLFEYSCGGESGIGPSIRTILHSHDDGHATHGTQKEL